MISNYGIEDDEWMNIPPIVRKTISQLEDDINASRRLTEALRSEHKQVNDLVRHLIDKQAGFEIDAVRQQLLNQGGASSSTEALQRVEELQSVVDKQRRKLKDVQAALESDHKVQEKLNNLVGDFVERKDAALEQSHEETTQLKHRVNDLSASVQARLEQITAERSELGDDVAQLATRLGTTQNQLDSLRTSTDALAGRLKDFADATKDVRVAVKNVQDSQKSHEEQNERRLDSLLRMVDKSQAVSEGQVESVKGELLKFRLHVTSEMEAQVKTMNRTSTDLHAKLRTVEENCADSVLRFAESVETLAVRSREQTTTMHELSSSTECLKRQIGENESHVASVSRRIEQLVTSDNHSVAERERACAKIEVLQSNVDRLNAESGHLRGDIKALQRDTGVFASAADVAALKREIDSVKHGQNEMRISLSQVLETLEKLSHAVEHVEQRCTEPAYQSRYSQTSDSDGLAGDVAAALSKERETRELGLRQAVHQVAALEQAVQHMTHQLSSMERVQVELASTCRLNTALQDEFGSTLKEVRPALVEMETVKRRIAALEADRSSELYAQSAQSASQRYAETRQTDLSQAVDDLKRREVEMLKTVQRLERRVDALSVQPAAPPAPAAERTTDDSDDAHGTVTKLSADITRTLETALAAETRAASFRSEAETRLRDCEQAQARAAEQIGTLNGDLTSARHALETLRAEQAKWVETRSAAQASDALQKMVSALQQQVARQSTQLEEVTSQLAAPTVKAHTAEYASLASLKALESRLRSAEGELKGMSATCSQLVGAASAKLSASVDATTERVEALSKAVTETEVKGQRATAMVTRRMNDVSTQLLAVRKAQEQCDGRLAEFEAQLAKAPPSSPESAEDEPVMAAAAATVDPASQEVVDALAQRLETLVAELSSRIAEVEDAQSEMARAQEQNNTADDVTDGKEGDDAPPPPYYPRDELEERLENMWASIVSLLARKDDQESVNKKLDGLHRLVGDELQVHLRRLERDVDNVLSEKVSLAELQEILESSAQA